MSAPDFVLLFDDLTWPLTNQTQHMWANSEWWPIEDDDTPSESKASDE